MNRRTRLLTTVSLFLALAAIHQSLMAETSQFSVMELPAVEGGDGPQVAVKWSGALPASLQPGYEDEHGRFVAAGSVMRLDQSMNLLPLPPEPGQGTRAWQVLDSDGQVLAQQRSGSTTPGWQPGYFSSLGVSASVRAVVEFEGDLIVAGGFLTAGDQVVNRIARWDGTAWSALSGPSGTGVSGNISALTVHDGALIAGGFFIEAGGVAVNNIARWDGTAWSALSGPSGTGVSGNISALTVHDGALIAGGDFTEAGGVTVNRIARWDGTAWSALSGPSGSGANDAVLALTVHDGALIAGGDFTEAGGVTVNRIARWNGTAWSALSGPSGTGVDSTVYALTVYNGALIAGGLFTEAGGVTVNRIARWDGMAWSALSGPSGTGVTSLVQALAVHDGALIAGGYLIGAGGVVVNRIARWDGTAWSALSGPGPSGTGVNNWVAALTIYENVLIVGGNFTEAGGVPVNYLTRWDGTAWSALSEPSGAGIDSRVRSLTVYDGALIAGGDFTQVGGMTVNHIARWDGTAWSALSGPSGTGVNSVVWALTVHEGALIAGGQFSQAGGVTANHIAHWDGTAWSALTGPSGTGVGGNISALTVHDGALIAGGIFTQAGGVTVNHIARWDGTAWSALSGPSSTGVDASVWALTHYDGALIAGGFFTEAGGVTVNRIARWDGTAWSALSGPSGTGVSSPVVALTVHDGALIAGGSFTEAGGMTVNRLARWDGTAWSALSGPSGTGVSNTVEALTVHDGALIAGGSFTEAGGMTVNRVARWNGTAWSALPGPSGTGVNGRVFALTAHDGALIAGGDFTQAGGLISSRIGEYRTGYTIGGTVSGLAGSGLVLQNNAGDDLAIGSNGSFVFDTALLDGTGYDVTVAVQPTNLSQTCIVANGSGTLAGADVTNVEVTCTTDQFTVGGTVTGLQGDQVVLRNNGGDDQMITADGGFTFSPQDDGTSYGVTVAAQPSDPSQTCSVSNGAGNLAGADVADVEVTCTTDSYTVITTAANGMITSTIDPVVEWGQTTTVNGQADANHYFAAVDGCNGTQQTNSDQSITDFSYETGAIEADCSVTAEFSIRTYSMTSTVGSGQGTIDVLTPIVNHGSDADFDVTPEAGWSLQSVVGDTCTPSDNGDGTWTATAITADCEVTADFVEDTTISLAASMSPAIVAMPVTYTITVTGTASAPADGQVELVSDLDGVICSLSGADSTSGQTAVFSCEHTWSAAGEHQLTATFSASGSHGDGEDVLQQVIVSDEAVFSDRFEIDP